MNAVFGANPSADGLEVIKSFRGLVEQGIPAKPHAHCVLGNLWGAQYRGFQPLEPGVGLGGFRMRTDCEGALYSVAAGKSWEESVPTLVSAN